MTCPSSAARAAPRRERRRSPARRRSPLPVIDDQQGGHDEHAHVNRRVGDARRCPPAPSRRTSAGGRMPRGARCRPPPARAAGSRRAPGARVASCPRRWRRGPRTPLAFGDAREHEVGDVHARDQQEDGHGAHEQPADPRGVADPAVAQRLHVARRHARTAGQNVRDLRHAGAPASVPRARASRPA